ASLPGGSGSPGASARAARPAQAREALAKGCFPLGKAESRADLLGKGEAFLGEHPPTARVEGSRVSPRLPELDDVDAEQVARLFRNAPRALVVGDRLRVVAPLVMERPSVLIGGRLRERVLDLLGQGEAAVDINPGSVEFASG